MSDTESKSDCNVEENTIDASISNSTCKEPLIEKKEKWKDDLNDKNIDSNDDHDLNKESENENDSYGLEPGDHIYSWRAMGTYSHHGIVLSVTKVSVVIIDFYPTKSYSLDSNTVHHCPPLRIINLSEWKNIYGRPRKVQYNAPYLKRTFYRSGTCCSMESHPFFFVLARARFLLLSSDFEMQLDDDDLMLQTSQIDIENESLVENTKNVTKNNEDKGEIKNSPKIQKCYIPKYHALHSNSETLCVWCKTGHYSTLQVADFLHLTWAGQLKSSLTLSAYLSTQTVQIPAAGVWGYMGFTTKVGLLSTQPLLLPALIGYGVLTVGTPLYMLRKCHSAWNRIEQDLNDLFWRGGLNSGDVSLNDLVLDCLDFYLQTK